MIENTKSERKRLRAELSSSDDEMICDLSEQSKKHKIDSESPPLPIQVSMITAKME